MLLFLLRKVTTLESWVGNDKMGKQLGFEGGVKGILNAFKKATKQSKLPWKLIYCSCVLWLEPLYTVKALDLACCSSWCSEMYLLSGYPMQQAGEPSVIYCHTNALL